MSSFGGLSTALSALYAQRRGLDVTGQNIANANTAGYSRQRVAMQAVGGTAVPAMYSVWSGAGAGVSVTDVTRLRDGFLDERARIEHAQLANLTGSQRILDRLEQVFREPSDTGLQSQLADLWSGWDDLANRPGDLAARTQLLQSAEGVATTLRNAHTTLTSLWTTTRGQLDAQISEVNSIAGTVADLNQAVVRANLAGLPANEFADQRDQLVLRLAELTGARAVPRDNGGVEVLLGGSSLVSGGRVNRLEVVGATRMQDQDLSAVTIRWAGNEAAVTVSSGEIAAALQSLSSTLPTYADGLDRVALNLADVVGTAHQAGYDLDGQPGGPFYTFGDPTRPAATIGLAITDPRRIAASTTFVTDPDTGVISGDRGGGNAAAIAAFATGVIDPTDPTRLGPDATYRQLVVGLGVAAQSVNRQADIQHVIVRGVDGSREAASGVSLDEEMTNLLSYQRAYEAATRVIATINSTFDDLFNMIRR